MNALANPRSRSRGTIGMFPVLEVRAVEPDVADDLLERWAHPLGPLDRPFGREDWVRYLGDEPIALATSASLVGACAAGWTDGKPDGRRLPRGETVELARIARTPALPRALRAMLRDWTDYLGPCWSDWPVAAAASYAMPGHPGSIYRADGWENWGRRPTSTGGGTWSGPGRARPHGTHTTLWVWRYPEAVAMPERDAA